jgi:hypothetical protein
MVLVSLRRSSELVLVAHPCRVEIRSFPDSFRHVTATSLPQSL